MDLQQQLRTISSSFEFDEAWYRRKHPDVEISGLDPVRHFLSFGGLLRRDPGPDFDSGFYLDTYVPTGEGNNPLLDYLFAPDRKSRCRTRAELRARIAECDRQTQAVWGTVESGLQISYCIPVMNRLDDLKGTLRENLDQNRQFRGKIEFVVALFDEDDTSEHWLRAHFGNDLADGYLRVIRDRDTLDSWHFGKAKNAFRKHLRGSYYSSLDGDNFVTVEETRLLLDLTESHPWGFVLHHFSGNWGDGTSGRVTLPTMVYRQVGYDPGLLPRQYDEVDLMLGALKQFPELPFVSFSKTQNIRALSHHVKAFWQTEKLANRCEVISPVRHRSPMNPRGANYTELELYLRHMNNFNASLSALRRAPGSAERASYLARAETHKHRLLDSLPQDRIVGTLFEARDLGALPETRPDDLVLFACVCNEDHFLPRFIQHYRDLGVTRFILVDDHSDTPVNLLELGADIHVFRPKVGDFKTSKTLWLEGLMRAFLPEGAWALVADADEFMQLPEPWRDLPQLVAHLQDEGHDLCVGLLLDMVADPEKPTVDCADFEAGLSHFLDRSDPVTDDYAALPPIAWAFGSHADISWRVDIRHHAFGTVDSLRKIPLFRLRKGRHLNQGFHTLTGTDGRAAVGRSEWTKGPILPIFHYKLLRLYSDAMRHAMLEAASGYHDRTAENIQRIFGLTPDETLSRIAEFAAMLHPGRDAIRQDRFAPSPPRSVRAAEPQVAR